MIKLKKKKINYITFYNWGVNVLYSHVMKFMLNTNKAKYKWIVIKRQHTDKYE